MINGLKNHAVRIPGTDVMCHMGVWDRKPHEWTYSLWTGEGDDERMLKCDTLKLENVRFRVTPEMAAHMIALLNPAECKVG